MTEPSISEPPPQIPERPKVIYVMGAGRSGSTILGVTLGNCQNVFYAGELDAWLARSGEPQLGGTERTRFWRAISDEVQGADELFGWDAQRYVERSLSLFRIHRWPARRRLRGPYRRISEEVYQAVSRATDGMLVVDTSHYPLRARELQALNGIDLYLLYLVRDPQSVVASFNRRDVAQYTKSTLTTNVYLWLTNLLAAFVFLKHRRDRRLFVRYEDFIADPEQTLRDILRCVGVAVAIPDLTKLKTGIPFQGNRVIASEVIALEAETSAPAQRSRITALLQFPFKPVFLGMRSAAVNSARRRRPDGRGRSDDR